MKNFIAKKLIYQNDVVNKKKLQDLMYQTFHNYGIVESALIADKIKNLTFHYATRSGISLNAEDLRVPDRKRDLIDLTNAEVQQTEQKYASGLISSVERFQKVIDIWNNVNNTLKDEVLTYFRESDPLNPLYIMAFSGARGNISQVRQLVGMRGLMANPQGQIIDLPIKSNFREGLKVTEYVISSYGARKGLVDTALRTADSGYLTRRLVDVAQDIIVREEDCLTQDSLSYEDLFKKYKTNLSLKDRLIGRFTAKPLIVSKGNILAPSNTAFTTELLNKIEEANYPNIYARSPLTCNSNRSVCRKCYGWHLSYSRLIDLGEAVGIIAAQSIGEPGTQLTMRTFHTGGVFSGDLTKQIRAPFPGTVIYNADSSAILVRNMHGEKGFQLNETVDLYIENISGTRIQLRIPQGNILLVQNRQKVYTGQILAEIKKNANLILEEDQRNIYTEVSGETFFQELDETTVVDEQGAVNQVTKKSGLIWVLHGKRYSLPKFSHLKLRIGEKICQNKILATYPISNKFSGIVKFDSTKVGKTIKILTFSMIINNIRLKQNSDGLKINLLTDKGITKYFRFSAKPKQILKSEQTLATLEDEIYKTKTGGIVFYDLEKSQNKKKSSTAKPSFAGILYWIAEETHTLNLSLINNLTVKPNTVIPSKSELWPGTFSKLSGLVQIDELRQELIIKEGELYLVVENREIIKRKYTESCFAKPGETLIKNVIVTKLSYVEFLEISGASYLFVRPVQIFHVPREKGFKLEYCSFPVNMQPELQIKTVKRILLKNYERVKSNSGITLLQTFLVVRKRNKKQNLYPQVDLILSKEKKFEKEYKLQISLYENFKEKNINTYNSDVCSIQDYLVFENQFIFPQTIVAQVQIYSQIEGTFISLNKKDNETKEILILKNEDIKEVKLEAGKNKLKVKKGDLVRVGSSITDNLQSTFSGQIYNLTNKKMWIRLGRPYLISEGTILRVNNNTIVQRSDILATLIYEKLKTVDIVQGLPKVEEILEARKLDNSDKCLLAPCPGQVYRKNSTIEIVSSDGDRKSLIADPKLKLNFKNGDFIELASPLNDGQIGPHIMLKTLFDYYKFKMPLNDACKLSFKGLQLFLVNEVQRTYFAQGVQIADKHVEVIIKQMTSKVVVEDSGDTMLLPGEIVSLTQIDQLTNSLKLTNGKPIKYIPILLGLTKASLNSDSFISAASFQETTRVLTEAAIEGKKDWLVGLKENVIIGRLIPAGTGFNYYEHLQKVSNSLWQTEVPHNVNRQGVKDTLLSLRQGKENK